MGKSIILLGIMALLLAACTASPVQPPTATLPPTLPPIPSLAPTQILTPTPPALATLEIWLPPQLAPSKDTPQGVILQERLDAFSERQSGVSIQVRVKALEGPGGILELLASANAAAPLSLPDLVALPRPLLETAALKGLVYPFDDLIADPEDSDWFDYALRLARLQDSVFGMPFAGDALVLVYRTEAVAQPPATIEEILQSSAVIAFPAADPQALVSLALYQAAGGEVLDSEGRPILQEGPLTQLLTAYRDGAQSELMPLWLTQLQSDDQAWDAFQKNQSDMVITWASNYLADRQEGVSVAPMPTLDGNDFTLATGWVWALASVQPEHQEAASLLAEFLSETDFLGEWAVAAGYLPPRPSALAAWQDNQLRVFIRSISLSTMLVPSADVLPGLAAPLVGATVEMLKLESDPVTAARQAAGVLTTP